MSAYYIAAVVCVLAAVVCLGAALPVWLAHRRVKVRAKDEALARRAASFAMSGKVEQEVHTRFKWLSARLEEAGMDDDAAAWLSRHLVVAGIAFAACLLLVHSIALAIIIAVAVFAIGGIRIMLARGKRAMRFEEQLTDALPMMAEGLRGGQSPARSLTTVAQYMDDPLKAEFTRAASDMGYGMTLTAAMDDMVRRVPCKDLRLLASVVAINAESGGSLSGMLDSIAKTMQETSRMRGHIRSVTATGRMSAIIVASLPWVTILALEAVMPSYLAPLLENGAVAVGVFALVAVMDLAGLFIINRMYKFEM